MTTPAPESDPGGIATFNILHAFPEALVRGMRSSFLADSDYHHLTQCETLDDVRLNMSESDYAESVADMTSLAPTGLQKVAIEKVRVTLTSVYKRPDRRRHFPHVESSTSSTCRDVRVFCTIFTY